MLEEITVYSESYEINKLTVHVKSEPINVTVGEMYSSYKPASAIDNLYIVTS
jgi:hypothetical protein